MADGPRVVLLLVSPETRKAFWEIISTGEINPHHRFIGGNFTLDVSRIVRNDQIVCELVCLSGLGSYNLAHSIAFQLHLVQVINAQTPRGTPWAMPVAQDIYLEAGVTPEYLQDALGLRSRFAEAICEAVRKGTLITAE